MLAWRLSETGLEGTMWKSPKTVYALGVLADYEENDRLPEDSSYIKSHNSDDLRLVLNSRKLLIDQSNINRLFREPGQFAALPNSEITSPLWRGTTEGIIMGDVQY
jgi:hypothetical protein